MKIEESRLCRLCLRTDPNEIFQEVGDTIKGLLDALQLKLNFQISEECVVCSNCMESIQKCFDFISTCRNAESFILPFCNSESESKLNLKYAYTQINTNTTIGDVPVDQEICRICIKLNKSLSCRPLIEVDQEMLQKYIPDLNFKLTEGPVICDSCLNSLKFYFQFLQTCNDTEEKIIKYCKFEATDSEGPINLCKVLQYTQNMLEYERDIAKVNVSDLDGVCCETKENDVKTEMTIKKESAEFDREYAKIDVKMDVDENVMKIEINEEPLNLQDEELKMIHEQHASETKQSDLESFRDAPSEATVYACENCLYLTTRKRHLKRHNLLVHQSSEVAIHNCDQCSFKTKYKQSLYSHMLVHQNLSEVTGYTCEICSYVTKHKSNLRRHNMLVHQSSEVYNCDQCSFKTKYKYSLSSHMLVHQNLSEVIGYTCEICSHITKRKSDLNSHMLIHRSLDITCEQCPFKTKHKKCLRKHMLIHQKLSDVTLYGCDQCSFKTRHKYYLKGHMLIHQEPSEVKMYKCESCSFATKQKSYLKSHMLIHKELSEVIVYTCESCPYTTKHKSNLNSHNKLLHQSSQIILYNCNQCSFKTKYKSTLKRHMLNH